MNTFSPRSLKTLNWYLLVSSVAAKTLMFGFFFFFLSFCDSEIWTQVLHFKPLHQPFFLMFYRDQILWTICPAWLQTTILLISASWVVRIIGISHQHTADVYVIFITLHRKYILFSSGHCSNFLILRTLKFHQDRSMCSSVLFISLSRLFNLTVEVCGRLRAIMGPICAYLW
jgi:hypothetical protein